MGFISFSQKYIKYFFLSGHGPHVSKNLPVFSLKIPRAIPFHLAVYYIPSLIHLLFLTVSTVYYTNLLLNRNLSVEFGMYSTFLVNKFVICIIVLKSSPLFSNNPKKIWSTFDSLEQYSSRYLLIKWSYTKCNAILLKQFAILCIVNILKLITILMEKPLDLTLFLSRCLVLLTYQSLFHTLFYLETQNFAMKTINKSLPVPKTAVFEVQSHHEKAYMIIEVLKSIHYKLWKINKLINRNFGWILVCLIMQKLTNTANGLIEMFFAVHEHGTLIPCLGAFEAITFCFIFISL